MTQAPATTAGHEARTRTFRVLLALAVALGLAGLTWSVVVAVGDLVTPDEDWDGFGLMLGVLVGVPSLLVSATSFLAFRLTSRKPSAARWLGGVAGALLVLPCVLLTMSALSWIPGAVGVWLVVLAALGPARSRP